MENSSIKWRLSAQLDSKLPGGRDSSLFQWNEWFLVEAQSQCVRYISKYNVSAKVHAMDTDIDGNPKIPRGILEKASFVKDRMEPALGFGGSKGTKM